MQSKKLGWTQNPNVYQQAPQLYQSTVDIFQLTPWISYFVVVPNNLLKKTVVNFPQFRPDLLNNLVWFYGYVAHLRSLYSTSLP